MEGKTLEGKRILMVISPLQFRDEEFSKPKEAFEEAGVQVTVASNNPGVSKGMFGLKHRPDILIRSASPADYDALVIVGGAGSPLHLWPDVALQKLARDMHEEGKVVAAICLSSVVLSRAGVLKDKEATVFETKDSVRELEQAGAKYVQQDVVDSGNVVTANGPEAAVAFARRILKVLGS